MVWKTLRMAFAQSDVDELLARTGRMCAVCNRLHGVQVHHIVPRHLGGSDDVTNAIPLCPNCHDEVHARHAPGRTTRVYTERELRGHLARTIDLANRQAQFAPGSDDWNRDVELVGFYGMCLDRPAFRVHFHNELSFADFDQALEDVILAINTGLWRTRDGTLIERSAGKRTLTSASWRAKMDNVVDVIVEARHALRQSLNLDHEFISMGHAPRWLDDYGVHFRRDPALGQTMDGSRQHALDIM